MTSLERMSNLVDCNICNRRWCSRDRNLRDRDQDLVKNPRWDWDFIKNLET